MMDRQSRDQYDILAPYYDELQGQVDSSAWAAWLDELAREKPEILADPQGSGSRPLWLDLGCGTGSMLLALHGLGYDLIGIDGSEGMLDQARQKIWDAGLGTDILLLHQDITDFELYGSVNVCSILLDTLNHLPETEQLRQVLRLCHNYLHPEGLLIFDVVTERHARERLGNQQFFVLADSYALFWEHSYREEEKISTAELTLFEEDRRRPGTYLRHESTIQERIYPEAALFALLEEAGFRDMEKRGLQNSPADDTAGRVFYLARK